jgi:AcrR family transcriptional regulator
MTGAEDSAAVEEARRRILAAMVRLSEEHGARSLTVADVAAQAGISSSEFYEHFDDLSDCLLAVFADAVQLAHRRAAAAAAGRVGWSEQVRAGLLALLDLLDEQPGLARVCVTQALAGGISTLTRNGEPLRRLTAIVEQGRSEAPAGHVVPPHAAEGVIGAALGVIQTRLMVPGGPVVELINPLMAMIVLPYLGEEGALRELYHGRAAD